MKRRKWWIMGLSVLVLVVASFVLGGANTQEEIAPGVIARIAFNPRTTTVTVWNKRTTPIDFRAPMGASNYRMVLNIDSRIVSDGGNGMQISVPPGERWSWSFSTYAMLGDYYPMWPWMYQAKAYWDPNIDIQTPIYKTIHTDYGRMWLW